MQEKVQILLKKEKGITLVALVITIVILIILATVTINATFGENGIIKKAQEAKEMTSNAIKSEEEGMNELLAEYANIIAEDSETPEVLEIGSTVLYNPSGTYNWQAKYCSSDLTGDVLLSSATGEDFNILNCITADVTSGSGIKLSLGTSNNILVSA